MMIRSGIEAAPSSPNTAGQTLRQAHRAGPRPGHSFHQNERGQTRYTISPTARRELLRRLLELNLQVASQQTSAGGTS